MNQTAAFGKKEVMEQLRSGKMTILLILFCLFGIMNPAVAKLTPWMMEMMADSLAETGLAMTHIEVNALTSWTQFYKNLPILLIVFVVMYGGILTGEIRKGTLIPIVTKGMKRWKIMICKWGVMSAVWTAGYAVCYGITYGYNAYFWDNKIAGSVAFGAFCFYVFGLWILSVIPLASALVSSGTGVVLFTGAVFGVSYIAGIFAVMQEWVPTRLMSAMGLLTGAAKAGDYKTALMAALVCMVGNLGAAVAVFNRRAL